MRGQYHSFNGVVDTFCAVGGLQYADSDVGQKLYSSGSVAELAKRAKLLDAARNRARLFLSRAISQGGYSEAKLPKGTASWILDSYIIAFNDRPERTKDEVLKAFDRAISNAKRRHLNG